MPTATKAIVKTVGKKSPASGIKSYGRLLKTIEAANALTSRKAAVAVNQWLVMRNWLIGSWIVEFEQGGRERAKYGDRLLERLAKDLVAKQVKGLELRNLRNCRLLYQIYPSIRQTLSAELRDGRIIPSVDNLLPDSIAPAASHIRQAASAELALVKPGLSARGKASRDGPAPLSPRLLLELSWSKLVELIAIPDPWKRAFYETECLKGAWSVRQLQRQIESLLYERTGLSSNKKAIMERARRQEPQESIEDIIRDPYVLEFAGLAERAEYSENDLETALLNHLQQFLLELGTGFCFEARQFRITTAGKHHRVDLVFYHRVLRCHVLLDLKIRNFRHGDAGQMNFYLNWFKANLLNEGDNPPVGIVLCSGKNRADVEFATSGLDSKLFVSDYLIALPRPEQLKELLEADRARMETSKGFKKS